MRISSIKVEGFANFSQPVTVGPLKEINAFLGANNVGKSNLMRALELYFRLLAAGEEVNASINQGLDRADEALREMLPQCFHWRTPRAITLEVEWYIATETLQAEGLETTHDTSRVVTTLQLSPAPVGSTGGPQLRVSKWMIGNTDAASGSVSVAVNIFARQLRTMLGGAMGAQAQRQGPPFRCLGADPQLFPQSVRDSLFDARHSMGRSLRRRWDLFEELAGSLEEELGPGRWDTVFDRVTGHTGLVYAGADATFTPEMLGAGVQRFAGLVAELCLATEGWVCIPEPERNLSLPLQARLVQVARKVFDAGVGPRQLFVTTHSPALANLCVPFVLGMENGSPAVEKRVWTAPSGGSAAPRPTPPRPARAAAPASPPPTPAAADAEGGPQNLDDLIGLVDNLAELDLEELAAE